MSKIYHKALITWKKKNNMHRYIMVLGSVAITQVCYQSVFVHCTVHKLTPILSTTMKKIPLDLKIVHGWSGCSYV